MRRQPFFSRHVALVSLWVGIVVASNMTIVSWDRLRGESNLNRSKELRADRYWHSEHHSGYDLPGRR